MNNQEFLEKLSELEFTPLNYENGFDGITIPESSETSELQIEDDRLYEIFGQADQKNNDNEYKSWREVHEKLGISKEKDKFNYFGLGKWEEVYQFGGEGQGDDYYVVLYFPDYNKYIRADAWYASYHGVDDWQDWYLVKPEEEVIIVYNSIKEEDNG